MTDRSAFTVVELVTTIAILLILAALISVSYKSYAPQIARVKCLGNLRSLHVSLGSYLNDVGRWPQIPESEDTSNEKYETWWLAELAPFGATERVWKCPILTAGRITDSTGYELRMHYVPADFDANPISPRRWSNMPWIVERGNNHGRGALALFPDGATRPFVP